MFGHCFVTMHLVICFNEIVLQLFSIVNHNYMATNKKFKLNPLHTK